MAVVVMAEQTKEIQIGPHGRLVVPADLRRELGLNPGGAFSSVLRADAVTDEATETPAS
jgi:bifunctional DNA-binding transcriptional regulator/antitoxin component of YhaV-PrlF toxin-antitoxin module